MKFLTALMTIIALAYSLNSFAVEPAKDTAPMHHGGGMGHGGMMMGGDMDETHLKSMQEHILQMHDISNKILAETDSAKKEQLKQQQRDMMKAHHVEMMAKHGAMK